MKQQVVALRLVVRPPGPRVVLDTNLFVAAYWSPRSASARILEACENDRLCLVYSPAIRREVDYILRNAQTSVAYRQRVSELFEDSEEVHPELILRLVHDDPDDDKFVECAVAAAAAYLITNDEHLLRLSQFEGVEIVTPAAFVRQWFFAGHCDRTRRETASDAR